MTAIRTAPLGASLSRRVEAAAGVAIVIALCVSVELVDPQVPGHYPTCPFHAVTHLWCPGCGSLRATRELLRGHLLAALHFNALAVLVLPLALLAGLRVAVLDRPALRLPVAVGRWVLVVLAVWVLARNIPVRPLTLLAP